MTRIAPAGIETMLLLSDGTVMAQGSGISKTWYKLTPDASGSYVQGTWSTLASMHLERLYYGSDVLPDGRVFLLGGEYSGPLGQTNWTNTGEIYDPVADTWTNISNFPRSNFGDDPTALLPDGRILAGYLSGPQTYIYTPSAGRWDSAGTKLRSDQSDEETWVKLPDNSILSYNVWDNGHSQRYVPAIDTWVDAGTLPVALSSPSAGYELGPAFRLPDGRVWFTGATGQTAYYTPSNNSWVAGPVIPNHLGADDDPGAMMPNGHVLLAVDHYTPQIWTPPTSIFEFDPTTNTYTEQTPTESIINLTGSAYNCRMLVLPSGQVLLTDGGNQLAVWTPSGSPDTAWKPTIAGITSNGDGTFTLAGTQLNGISEGASYGDDAEMSSNYPIVQLSDSDGHIYYARSFNWSSTGVATGSTPVTTKFRLPAGITGGVYNVTVIANGVASNSFSYSFGGVSGGVTHYSVIPSTTSLITGTAFSVTVKALDVNNNVASGYRGTVTFTSDDGQATLPGNYTFTAADNGIHTFSGVILRTAGDRTLTIRDPALGLASNGSITVLPAAADHLAISASTLGHTCRGLELVCTASTGFDVTVTARDSSNNIAPSYRGTVHFTSSDGLATLPPNYTFAAADAGAHTFTVILRTAGSQTLTVTDTATPSIRGSANLTIDATLDPTFGNGGVVTTDFPNSEVRGFAIQPDGKIVAAGETTGGDNRQQVALARYTANGQLDPTFGGSGKITMDFGTHSKANGVVLQPDGKVVAAGYSDDGQGHAYFGVARFTTTGALDPSFGNGGKVTTDISGNTSSHAYAVALEAEGRILVAGGASDRFALARYLPDGSLDPSFGNGGKVLDWGGPALIRAITVQPDGRIVAVGSVDGNGRTYFALARYLANGNPDPSFGSGGHVTTDWPNGSTGATAVALQPDGKIVAAGESNYKFALARYLPNGSLDSTFGSGGRVTTDYGSNPRVWAVAIQGDGKIVAGGNSGSTFALARYLPNGTLDAGFGNVGKVTTAIGNGSRINAIGLQSDGRILAAGWSDGRFALALYQGAVRFINPAGGDWAAAGNWSTGHLPGPTDDVIIDLPNITVTHSSGSDSIRSLTTKQNTFVLSGGSLSVSAASTIASTFNFTGGTLTGSGDLTVSGNSTWSGGSMAGTGKTVIAATGQLTIQGGSHGANRLIDSSAGPLNWVSGQIGGAWTNTGQLTISGNADKRFNGGTFTKYGTTLWSGTGNLQMDNGAVFNNQMGAVFDAQSDATLSGSGTFANAGTFIKSAGTDTTTVGVSFTNTGTLSVQSGTVNLSGAFSNFSGSTLTGGTYLVTSTLQFSNANIVTNAATIVLDGPASRIVNQSRADALAHFATNAAAGSFTVQNGRTLTTAADFSDAGILVVGPSSTFTVTGTYGQTGTANVQDTGTLTLQGPFSNFDISSGTLTDGTYLIAGAFQFSDAATAPIATNAATLILDGGDAQVTDLDGNDALAGSLLANAESASLTLLGGAALSTPADFGNAGTLTVGDGSTFTVAGTYLQSDGLTLLVGGTLAATLVDLEGGSLAGSGTINGDVTNAAEIDVGGSEAAGVLTITGNFTQTGAGVLNLKLGSFDDGTYDQLTIGGTATLDGTLNVGLLDSFFARDGDTYQVLAWGSVRGNFATLNLPDLGDGFYLDPALGDSGLTLTTRAQ